LTNTLVLEDPAAAAAARLAEVVRAGGQIALSGGSTPPPAYEWLAAMELDWSSCTLWLSDERCVPPDDRRSNYRLVREVLLDRLRGDAPEVRRIRGEEGPHPAAAEYERELGEAFGDRPPALDLVLLGLGPDGHFASLFPGQPALEERQRLVVGVERPSRPPLVAHVTLTLPAINAAREVVFLVTGEDKAEAVERAFSNRADPGAPATLVAPTSGRLTVLLDAAAARRLRQSRG
jgi:6-phosphogluconolactonase